MITTNPWKKFQALLPEESKFIATVVSHEGTDRSVVQLRSGDQIHVVGQQVAPGGKAWVVDGRIVESAPDLPYVEIDV